MRTQPPPIPTAALTLALEVVSRARPDLPVLGSATLVEAAALFIARGDTDHAVALIGLVLQDDTASRVATVIVERLAIDRASGPDG